MPHENKVDQRSVNYRSARDEELEQCSLCENWAGFADPGYSSASVGLCDLVSGTIFKYGICDLYEKGPTFYERYYGSAHAGAQDLTWCEVCQDWTQPSHRH